jgi:hypothetical protein
MNEGIGSRACAAMTDCSSDLSRTGERIASTAKEVAAVVQPIFSIYRRCRVEQHRDPGDASAISLSSSTDLPIIVGSVVKMKPVTLPLAARARDEAAVDRVGNERENDGDGARFLKQRPCGGYGARKKEIRL